MEENAKHYQLLSNQDPATLKTDWTPYTPFLKSERNNNPRCSIKECTNTARHKDLCLSCYSKMECRPSWKYCQLVEDGTKCGRKIHSHKMCRRHADQVRRAKKR